MMSHTWLITIGVLLALAGIAAFAFHLSSQPTTLRIAVGPPGGEDLRLVQLLAQHLARERAPIRLSILQQGGAAESADAIDYGEQIDLAVVRRDVGMPKDGQAVAILRRNVTVLLVPAPDNAPKAQATRGKKIEKVADLAARRIAVVGRSPANVNMLHAILRQYGIAPDKVTVVQLSTVDSTAAIRDSKADAVMTVGPVSSRITADVVAALSRGKISPTFLDVDAAEAVAQRNPVYEATEIVAGAFGPQRPEESIETVGVSHYIVARRTLDEQIVGDFTRLLFAARQRLAGELPAFSKIETPDTEKGAAVAVHPGASAYIDGEQKTFFDRYSEPLYWGLMLVSFAGSGLVWLASYLRADDRIRKLSVVNRLLVLMKAARSATSTAELDRLRDEADDMLRKTVRAVERGEVDETALSAFSLALDQVQIAISDRRAVLQGQDPARSGPQRLTVA